MVVSLSSVLPVNNKQPKIPAVASERTLQPQETLPPDGSSKSLFSTPGFTKGLIKGGIYGTITGTVVAGYKWFTKTLPEALKPGGSLKNAIEHPGISLGWKNNLLAAVAALCVTGYHITKSISNAKKKT